LAVLLFDERLKVSRGRDCVRATAVRRDAEQDAVLAGDPKGLDYYVILI